MKKISVLIADDHALVRMGLSALLRYERDMSAVGEAEDRESAVRQAKKLHPDVVVMDLKMPILDGVEATRRIHAANTDTKVLILTTFGTSQDAARAIAAGAAGAIVKDEGNAVLLDAIRKVNSGEKVFSREILETIENDEPTLSLTPRQLEILQSAARGLSNTDIALQFNLSKDSVKHVLSDVFRKLGAANRAEAVTIALQKNLLKI